MAREWARIIEEATDGRIKSDIYYSETLAKGNDIVAAVKSGLADAAILRQHAEPGKVPLCTVGEMPGVSSDYWAMSMAFNDLMHSDLMKAEFDSQNMVPFSTTFADDAFLIGNKAVRTVDDVKKIKISSSGINGQVISALGGTPLSISPPEMYEALYRGTVDALEPLLSLSMVLNSTRLPTILLIFLLAAVYIQLSSTRISGIVSDLNFSRS